MTSDWNAQTPAGESAPESPLLGSPSFESSPAHMRPPSDWVAEVFAQLESRLIAYAKRLLRGDDEQASDVVQEAFVKLCQQPWPEIQHYTTPWLYRTCRNRAIDLSRREGRMNAIRTGTDVSTVHDPLGARPEDRAEQGEQIDRMKRQIVDLPERQQEILRLRLHDGLSYKEIASVMGITATNVGYLLHQAISKLRTSMQVD